jgi:hypothetical protein
MSHFSQNGEVPGAGALTIAIIIATVLLMFGALVSTAVNPAVPTAAASTLLARPATQLAAVTARHSQKDL